MKWVVAKGEAAIIIHTRKPFRHDGSKESDKVENALGIRVGQDDIAQVIGGCYVEEIEEPAEEENLQWRRIG